MDTATYQCIPGYELTGTETIVCQNGKWSDPPTCTGMHQHVHIIINYCDCVISITNVVLLSTLLKWLLKFCAWILQWILL